MAAEYGQKCPVASYCQYLSVLAFQLAKREEYQLI